MNTNDIVTRRREFFVLCLFVVMGVFVLCYQNSTVDAQDKINKTMVLGLAVEGYDTVAYFTEGKAIEGKKDYTFEWNGAKWRFASKANMLLFKDNPSQYIPQYGGYCAWSMSQGNFAYIDPQKWYIYNNKLYLAYNDEYFKKFVNKATELIPKADENWAKVKNN